MGVYIKGMEMPTSCYACMFFAQTDYWNKDDEADILSRCKRTGEKTWESVNGYLPNCPLVPVPPHGRLIDADELRELYEEWENDKEAGIDIDKCHVPIPVIRQNIDDAPTIIDA